MAAAAAHLRLRGTPGSTAAPSPPTPLATSSPNCTVVVGGCQACLDFGKGAADGGCVWCPQEGGCVSAFACLAPADTCPVNYVWIVSIWMVLSALICLCCLTCTTRRCLAEWRHHLRPSGARDSNSLGSSIDIDDVGGSSSPRRRQQRWRARGRGGARHDSLYDPLLLGGTGGDDAATTDPHATTSTQQPQQPSGGRQPGRESEEQEQEERADVFRNSLLAEAGEREWACAVCAFENRPRVPSCSLCGTAQEAGLRWHEEQCKYEERRAAGAAGADEEEGPLRWLQDPEQQLTLRQRAARRRRVWQRRVDGEGRVVWVRVPLKEALAMNPLVMNPGPAVPKEEEAPAPEEALLPLATRMRRRLFLPFVRRSNSPVTPVPPPPPPADQNDEVDGGDDEDYGRRSSSSFSFSSLFRGSREHQQRRRESEGGLSYASFASASPSLSPYKHQEEDQEGVETKEEGTVLPRAAAEPRAEDADDDGGLGCFVSVMGEREGVFDWLPASASQPPAAAIVSPSTATTAAARAPSPAPAPLATNPPSSSQSQPRAPPSSPSRSSPLSPSPIRWHWREADLAAIAALSSFRKKHFWFVEALRTGGVQRPWGEGHIRLLVARARLLEDSFGQLMSLTRPQQVRRWMRVQFAHEPGVDAGGLEREWFILISKALTDPALGLFVQEPPGSGAYGINPAALHAFGEGARGRRLALQHYYFAGRVFGKALMEHQTLPTRLSLPLRKHLLGAPLGLWDLQAADPALHRSLAWLLRPERTAEEVAGLHLDFTATLECLGQRIVRDLCPGGAELALTLENRAEYVSLTVQDRLLEGVRPQLWWLLRGFYEAVPRPLLQVFDYQELDLLLSGLPSIDVADWRRHTEYLGEYARLGERHRVIRWFWEVVTGTLDEAQRARLLQFTTGGCSVPAQGFKALQSNDGHFRVFNIQSVRRQDLLYQLPMASTCFNKLSLPVYESKEELAAALQLVCSMDDMATGFTID